MFNTEILNIMNIINSKHNQKHTFIRSKKMKKYVYLFNNKIVIITAIAHKTAIMKPLYSKTFCESTGNQVFLILF